MIQKLENKWVRAAIPALLIHCSIGTVYCWSLVKGAIASEIGSSTPAVEWAFSFAIFFLGMSAAFAGKFVEKNIHKSSLISMICFCTGMAGTGLFISLAPQIGATASLIGIYVSYGCVMGIGLGIGYLTPVKTLMLWFGEHKGLATGIAIAGFGMAKVFASPAMEYLQVEIGIANMFYLLAAVYLVFMFMGHKLLKKPADWIEPQEKVVGVNRKMVRNSVFIGIWLIFYINITCGLALIAQEKDILRFIGYGSIVAGVSALTAAFNTLGRIGFSTMGDKMNDRNTIYKIIFILSIAFCLITIFTGISAKFVVPVVFLLCFINAGYGGGFSNLPSLLSDRFGMKNISSIHGLALSAWAFAGLSGNQLSVYVLAHTHNSYEAVLWTIGALFLVALVITYVMVGNQKIIIKNK